MQEFENDVIGFTTKKLLEKGFKGLIGNREKKTSKNKEFEVPEEMKRTVPK